MRVFSVNHSSYGSTGMIMLGIHEELLRQGHESQVAWPRGRDPQNSSELRFNSEWGVMAHAALGRLDDRTGFHSTRATERLVTMIEDAQPDIVHLHNIHGYCLDIRVLFPALQKMRVPVVWTLHSCWPFTGHCTYFTYAQCDRWKAHCHDCPQTHTYPKSLFFDNSANNYDEKRALFTLIPNMTIVTPSRWLAGLVRESFLGGYECEVIRNGINKSIFKPQANSLRLKESLGIADKHMLLGVASPWSKRKGLEHMMCLREYLGSEYEIVLVGLSKKQVKGLPQGVIGLERTDSAARLAQLYAAADLFVNPTLEDNYPTVNLEALACGTHVITYDTGGSPECTDNRGECIVTEDKTPESLSKAIRAYFAEGKHDAVTSYIEDNSDCVRCYMGLYRRILGGRE